MRFLGAVCAIPVACLLVVLSLPFLMIAIGYMVIGDVEGFDRWMDISPLLLWIDWVNRGDR